jgi:hypothetical protein
MAARSSSGVNGVGAIARAAPTCKTGPAAFGDGAPAPPQARRKTAKNLFMTVSTLFARLRIEAPREGVSGFDTR